MSEPGNKPSEPVEPGGKREPTWSDALSMPLGLLGAIVGGALGFWVVHLAARSGYYTMPVIGLTVGYGTIFFARRGGLPQTLIAGVVCIATSVYAEWYNFPFRADPSFAYFLHHLSDLTGFTMLMHVVTLLIGGWVAWASPGRAKC